MLAQNPLKMTFLIAGALAMLVGTTFGQQTPSQIYQPTRGAYQGAPPSVHQPPSQAQQIPMYRKPTFKLPKVATPQNLRGQAQQNLTGRNYQQSKQAYRPQTAARPGYVQRNAMNGRVMQTSFQEEVGSEPTVPSILQGDQPTQQAPSRQQPANPAEYYQAPPQLNAKAFEVDENSKSPADFENAMGQIRTNVSRSSAPRVDADELASENAAAIEANEQRLIAERKAAEEQASIEAAKLAEQLEIDRLEQERLAIELENQKRIEAERIAAVKEAQRIQAAKLEAQRQQQLAAQEAQQLAEQNAALLKAEELKAAEQKELAEQAQQFTETLRAQTGTVTAEATSELSASEFVSQASATTAASPKLLALQGDDVPAVMNLATLEETDQIGQMEQDQPLRDTNVRPVSSEVDASPATISLAAPAIQVETYGPSTIGVNKPSTYQIVVKNNSSSPAERVLVGINMPQWVELENINLTTGDKEITDGQNQARLVWSVDKVPGNSTQTITVTAVPRKPEMFDVGVEWTLVPRVGKTNIKVTEPKLEMNISGPKEVLYGETALYHVTVRNPGTGSAENVVVMLPEALGGERATLGDITAGKEKNFQVELLARTAGDLNLVATAAAEGSLKTSAERALIVRRANLQIALEGPGLKYAGSIAQYNVTITNSGDATATDVVSAVALPTGVKYLGGIDSVKLIEGGMRWSVGSLDPGQTRDYKINCQLDTSGDLQLEVGARGSGELAASSACLTTVETVADLVLTVADPKGPLPTGQEVPYEIKVRNRGSKAAKGINLVMQFSEGIEPRSATGLDNKLVPGQVFFNPISKIDPGEEVTLKISAEAMKSGTHVFRAQLTCQDSDAREVAEGTTRFFGDAIESALSPATTSTARATSGGSFDLENSGDFKR